MVETKPWYLSRTIWASVVTVAAAMGSMLGLPVDTLDNQAVTETLLQTITAVSGLFAIFGRLAADTRIH